MKKRFYLLKKQTFSKLDHFLFYFLLDAHEHVNDHLVHHHVNVIPMPKIKYFNF